MNMEKLTGVLKKNPRDLDDKCGLFEKCTADEYKTLALFALKTLCEGKPLMEKSMIQAIEDGDISAEYREHGHPDWWAAHHITKAIFEEQDIFDPYADPAFISEAAAICPWYVKRYLDDKTRQQLTGRKAICAKCKNADRPPAMLSEHFFGSLACNHCTVFYEPDYPHKPGQSYFEEK